MSGSYASTANGDLLEHLYFVHLKKNGKTTTENQEIMFLHGNGPKPEIWRSVWRIRSWARVFCWSWFVVLCLRVKCWRFYYASTRWCRAYFNCSISCAALIGSFILIHNFVDVKVNLMNEMTFFRWPFFLLISNWCVWLWLVQEPCYILFHVWIHSVFAEKANV